MIFVVRCLIVYIGIILYSTGCNSTDPPIDNKESLNLSLEDVSCTEAWLKITGKAGGSVILNRDDNEIMRFNLISEDTTILNDSLLPNKSYTYQILSNDKRVASNKISAITMDTTSHNFTWEDYTFGEGPSDMLNDVSISDENNIWAVGEIDYYYLDSSGYRQSRIYNAVHWNGKECVLQPLQFFSFCGQEYTGAYPAHSIFDFGNYNMSISSSLQIKSFVNKSEVNTQCVPLVVNEIWGRHNQDYFIVGKAGGIARYQNGKWNKLSSGTNLYLTDIFGRDDIFICAPDHRISGGVILKWNNGRFEKFAEAKIVPPLQVFKPYLFGTIASLWIDEKNALYVGGGLLYRYKSGIWDYAKGLKGNRPYEDINYEHRGYITGIRGNSSNDFWICGEGNTLMHFNGYSWKQIGEPYTQQSDILWRVVEAKGNIAAAVGYKGYQAFLRIIRRN